MGKLGRLDVKNVKDLMQEMGFNPNSPVSTQMAFMRNLAKAAYNIDLPANAEENENSAVQQMDLFDKAS